MQTRKWPNKINALLLTAHSLSRALFFSLSVSNQTISYYNGPKTFQITHNTKQTNDFYHSFRGWFCFSYFFFIYLANIFGGYFLGLSIIHNFFACDFWWQTILPLNIIKEKNAYHWIISVLFLSDNYD